MMAASYFKMHPSHLVNELDLSIANVLCTTSNGKWRAGAAELRGWLL